MWLRVKIFVELLLMILAWVTTLYIYIHIYVVQEKGKKWREEPYENKERKKEKLRDMYK